MPPAVVTAAAVRSDAPRKTAMRARLTFSSQRLCFGLASREHVQVACEEHGDEQGRRQDDGGTEWARGWWTGRPSARTPCRAGCSEPSASIRLDHGATARSDNDTGQQKPGRGPPTAAAGKGKDQQRGGEGAGGSAQIHPQAT